MRDARRDPLVGDWLRKSIPAFPGKEYQFHVTYVGHGAVGFDVDPPIRGNSKDFYHLSDWAHLMRNAEVWQKPK